jgi:hypothetical protein
LSPRTNPFENSTGASITVPLKVIVELKPLFRSKVPGPVIVVVASKE